MTKTRKPRARSSPVAAPEVLPAPAPSLPRRLSVLIHLGVFVTGALVCGYFSVRMGQDNNWDLQNYHAYNAWAFLHDRLGFDIAPAQRQTYLNALADLPFYLGSVHLAPRTFAFLLGCLHGLAIGLIFGICFAALHSLRPRFRVVLALACTALGAYGPVFVGELGASENDNVVSLAVLASLWIFVRIVARHGSFSARAARRSLVTASVILGAGVGLKLTMMIHVLGVIAGVLVVERTWRDRGRVIGMGAVAVLAGFLLTNGYWMTRLWHQFGNPFFPFYNNIFKSVWAEPRSFADLSMVPKSFLLAILMPLVFTRDSPYTFDQAGFRDARYLVLYLLLITLIVFAIAGLFARRRGRSEGARMPVPGRFLLSFFVVSYVVWQMNFCIIRYTACMEAVAPLVIALVVMTLWRNPVMRGVVIAGTFLAIAYVMKPVHQQRMNWGTAFWRVKVPAIVDPDKAIVVIANSRPLAYLAPHFPPEVRWIGLKNNLTDPRRHSEMQETIQQILSTHRGEVYLLTRAIPDAWLEHDTKVLKYYRLEPVPGSGRAVNSLHSPGGLQLWRLQRSAEEPVTPAR